MAGTPTVSETESNKGWRSLDLGGGVVPQPPTSQRPLYRTQRSSSVPAQKTIVESAASKVRLC